MIARAAAIATHARRVSTISRSGKSTSRMTAMPLKGASFLPLAAAGFAPVNRPASRRLPRICRPFHQFVIRAGSWAQAELNAVLLFACAFGEEDMWE